MKKFLTFFLCAVMALSVCGCGFNFKIGNIPDKGSNDFIELFPDRAATWGKSHHESMKGYAFALSGYGDMSVYVDTTDGDRFELRNAQSGFVILDSKDNIVLSAECISLDQYRVETNDLFDTQIANKREFWMSEDDNGNNVYYSYLADVGLDCGLKITNMEEPGKLMLIALRGTPLPGASTDIYAYKGCEFETIDLDEFADIDDLNDKLDNIVAEIDDYNNQTSGDVIVGDGTFETGSLLPYDIDKKIMSLDTDYNRINWRAQYMLGDTGLVVSVAPFASYASNMLAVAVTNVSDEEIDIYAKITALDEAGDEIAYTYFFYDSIGVNNTVAGIIPCGDKIPDGRTIWSETEISESSEKRYAPWYADWTTKIDGEMMALTYEMGASGDLTLADIGFVYAFAVDADGNILHWGSDYPESNCLDPGDGIMSEIDFYGDDGSFARTTNIAIFANPTFR